MEPTVKDTVTVSLDLMTATCRGGCHVKYARKLIQDWLKKNTDYKGHWTVWFDEEIDGMYYFSLSNPMYSIYRFLSI